MIQFRNMGTNVLIRESSKRSDSMLHAFEASLGEVQLSLAALESGTYGQDVRPTYQPLGRTFFFPQATAMLVPAKLFDVARVGDNWELTLEGSSRAKFILNSKYEFVGSQRIPRVGPLPTTR